VHAIGIYVAGRAAINHPRKSPRCHGRTDHGCSSCHLAVLIPSILRFDLSLNCLDGSVYLFQRVAGNVVVATLAWFLVGLFLK
jgi:hypothetical protein